jgi:hypothetical protein
MSDQEQEKLVQDLKDRIAEKNASQAVELAAAKKAAEGTGKEVFDPDRFRAVYKKLNAMDVGPYTPWDTLIRESEYDYYVSYKDKMTLEELVEHIKYIQGFG